MLAPRLHFEPLERRLLLAADPLMLADIFPGDSSSSPSEFVAVDVNGDGVAFFVANDGAIGSELWKSDGTQAGTMLVKDIREEDGVGSYPYNLTAVDGTLFFTVNDGVTGSELWKSDGSEAGTVLVKDIRDGDGVGWHPANLTNVDGTLFFTADDGESGTELWKSDGTETGTVLVKDIQPGSSYPANLTAVGDTLFFVADDGEHGQELWKSDGSEGGTVLVKDIRTDDPYGYPSGSSIHDMTAAGGTLFFVADDGETAQELWKSDGSEAGTVLVKDIRPGDDGNYPNTSDPQQLTNVDGDLFFTADDGENGRELWKTDGSTEGTVLVKDIRPGSENQYYNDGPDYYGYRYVPYTSNPDKLIAAEGKLFFTADDGQSGQELWVSDGSEGGTVLVKDLSPGESNGYPSGTYIYNTAVVDGILFFGSDLDDDIGGELWQSNGTLQGTFLVADLFPGSSGSYPTGLTQVGGKLFFSATTEGAGEEPFTVEPATRIEGTAFADLDANGLLDDGEPLLEGFTIFMDANGNDLLDDGEPSTTTAADGSYRFDVEPGTHLVRSLAGAGFTQTAPLDPDRREATLALGDVADQLDFAFEVSVPAAVDLLAATDSGIPDDNVTNFNNATPETALQFLVTGVADGATVGIFENGLLLGEAVATGDSVIVVTDGQVALADDVDHSFFATQRLADVELESGPSDSLGVTFDTVAPAAIDSTPPEFAQAGEAFVYNANSPDEGIEGLTYSLLNAPDGMTIDAGGVVTWTPAVDQQGPQSLEIRLGDVAGNFAAQQVELTVLGVIAAFPDQYTVNEDEPLVVDAAAGVLANDNGDGADPLTASVVSSPEHGTLELNEDGSFTYTPQADFSGTDQFTYMASDGVDQSNVAPVTVTIVAVNDPPVAVDDTYTGNEDEMLLFDADVGVLANDSDVDGDTLTARLIAQPDHGVVLLAADGSFTYQPDADFFGTDTFTYEIEDPDDAKSTATATITVNPLEDAPIALDDEYTVDEDDVLTVAVEAGLLNNDFDVDSDVLVARVEAVPAGGTLSVNSDGSFVYTPNADFFGVDTFTYTVSDGKLRSAAATVTLNVTAQPDAPTAADDAFDVTKNGLLETLDVLVNDSSEPDDVQPLSIVSVTQGSAGGIVSVAADSLSILYTPAAGFTGMETFTYTIEDGDMLPSTATVSIDVTELLPNSLAGSVFVDANNDGVRDAGELGVPGSLITLSGSAEDGSLFTASLLSENDGSYVFEDVPAGTYDVTQQQPVAMLDGIALAGSHGGVSGVNQITGVVFEGDQDATGYNFGELGLRAEFISLQYYLATSPPIEELLRETVARAEDAAGNTDLAEQIRLGGSPPDVGEPDELVAVDDLFGTNEDTPLVIAAAGVLANDTGGDGPLSATLLEAPTNGSVALNDDGSFTYTPSAGFFGVDTFTYEVSDDRADLDDATVTITVSAVNDPPIGLNDSYDVNENETLTVDAAEGVLANDSDLDADPLRASVAAEPLSGTLNLAADGSFSYVPDADFSGSDTFTYQVSDGQAVSAPVTVSINVILVNVAPEAMDDAFEVLEDGLLIVGAGEGLLANDIDADGDSLSVVLVADAANGTLTLDADGSFVYVPNADFDGADTFTYRVNDGLADSGEATVTITVTPINDAPLAVDDQYSTSQLTLLDVDAASGVLANDLDPDGGSLPAVVIVSNSEPADGTLLISADGSFTYIPDAGFHGLDSFTYRSSDGLLESNVAVVQILVNDEPLVAGSMHEVAEDGAATVDTAAGALAGATDADDDPLTARLVDGPLHGTLQLAADGSFVYTPNSDFFGADSFTFVANDGFEDSALGTVTIDVTPVNDAPVAAADEYRVREGETFDIGAAEGVLANDSDVEDDSLSAELRQDVSDGALTLAGDGSFTYVADDGFSGTDAFTYVARDGDLTSGEVTVTIIVDGVPTAVADEYEIDEDTPLLVDAASGVLANDDDPEGADLTAVLVSGPENGSLTLNNDGSFTYTPEKDFVGTDSFEYSADDGLGGSMAVTVTITVKPVNDAPLAVADSYRVDEDQLLAIDAAFGLLANDVDVDDDVLSAILVSDVSDGTLSLESDGSFSYQPDENFVGGDSFTYLASDTVAESNEVTVAIVVDPVNDAPVARDDAYNVDNGATLIIDAAGGVLANDSDVDDDALVAQLDAAPANGTLTLSDDGSFTYTPDAGFSGTDSFTYRAGDSTATSNIATVSIDVAELVNEPFGPVKPGAFDDPNLLGIRTDLVPGAPPLTAEHVSTAFNYDGFSSPPTYGPHHGFLLDAQNNSITPRPTGVYSTEQPDEDLIHNLEHGHVWISYNPDLLSSAERTALEKFVEDGGSDTGAVAVAVKGKTILAKGYGFADYADTPNSSTTLFEIASTSKQITATAILKLEMEGKLSIGDSISTVFKDLPGEKKAITIHHLLTHTSGLSPNLGIAYNSPISRADYIKKMLEPDLAKKPGSTWSYSNVGYALLAAIVEEVTGGTFEDYVHEKL
ncbi:MAG: tandem-95 repeat protein, partial [Planctomycetes bacterium]|nr:tandem-95 repeat protein [Planctomycetota bacterium]